MLDGFHCSSQGCISLVFPMPIDPFTQQGAFGPEATAAMGEAFDAACQELRCPIQQEVIRELIASLIIAAASRRELDPVCLRMVALAGFAIFRPRALPVFATADAVDKQWSPIKRGGVSTC
jgi:hypothetical protein